MKKVVFIQRMVPDYRANFFYLLREALEYEGIDFSLVAGGTKTGEALVDAFPEEKWSFRCGNYYIFKNLYYQSVRRYISNADLVIVHEGGAALVNYELLLRRRLFGHPKVAFFGHGSNMNSLQRMPVKTWVKNIIARLPDWWFAYTNISSVALDKLDYPENKTSIVDNSIDTKDFIERIDSLDEVVIQDVRDSLGISITDTVGLFCGRLSKIKLSFLIDAVKIISEIHSNYHLIIVGRGDLEDEIRELAKVTKWLHYVGPKFSDERLPYFKVADHFLMPGQVGLGILDAFASKLPFFTTDCGIHSPEIAYLINGKNGYITENNVIDYSERILKCLDNIHIMNDMSVEAFSTSKRVSLEKMVSHFVSGIKKILF
ncbi:glycosyltransferase family 4 protein [Gammaproteobacteria bacterium AH-315-C21]|nr:glycosyltransferase family 4 protein [Gammaproteobacteria bacterium AH-315-C21]